ncbi:MAG: hypothetical protein LBT01_05330 [Spirochaetaceae bacterium]|jgi:hypothetical protein|nr:hypothetical protein [Spirochaetaceae bacterium]
MKNTLVFFLKLALLIVSSACASAQEDSLKSAPVELTYIEAKNFNNIPTINIATIGDFSKLISDCRVYHVFFTADTFFFQAPAISYPYSIASNGYKNIKDYISGYDKEFKDGISYYYANENKLTSQNEVDYYKQETFFSPEDYRKAQREGFVKSGASNRMSRIAGVVTEKNLKNSIRYANAIIWLLYYQRSDPVKEFLENTDIDKLLLPFTNNRSYPSFIVRFEKGYYFVNLDISGLQYSNKDAVFFYASKLAQYESYGDYQKNYSSSKEYTIKNSETIATRNLDYPSYAECLKSVRQMIN